MDETFWQGLANATGGTVHAFGKGGESVFRPTTDTERQRLSLAASAPLQSKGKPVEDAAHLPLFVAANEPGLPL